MDEFGNIRGRTGGDRTGVAGFVVDRYGRGTAGTAGLVEVAG